MASSRQEQQKLIKHAQNQIRKYGAKMASKILLKSVFTYVDAGIIVTYFAIGVKNRYGWRNAWK